MITLKQIKDKEPPASMWDKLLKSFNLTRASNRIVTCEHLLESIGIDDTFWVIFNFIDGELFKKRNMLADIAEEALKDAKSVLHIYEWQNPGDNTARKNLENAQENIRRCRAGEEQLHINYNTPLLSSIHSGSTNSGSASIHAAYAAYAACSANTNAIATLVVYGYAAKATTYAAAADADAAYKTSEDYDSYRYSIDSAAEEVKEKQKQIILKYFGTNAKEQ